MIANSVSLLLKVSFYKIKHKGKKKRGGGKFKKEVIKKGKCFKGEIHSSLVNLHIFMMITSTADSLNNKLVLSSCTLPFPDSHFAQGCSQSNCSGGGFEIQQGRACLAGT